MKISRVVAAATLSASLLCSPVRAEDELPPELSPTRPIDEVAVMLAYEYCPLVLNGTIHVSSSWEVQQLGFEGELLERIEPEFAHPLHLLEANRFDGKLGFAGRPANGCEVIVKGENRLATRAALQNHILSRPNLFKPEPAMNLAGAEVYSIPLRNGTLIVRLKDVEGNDPETILQISLAGCSTCRS